jgi:hypothetical protein
MSAFPLPDRRLARCEKNQYSPLVWWGRALKSRGVIRRGRRGALRLVWWWRPLRCSSIGRLGRAGCGGRRGARGRRRFGAGGGRGARFVRGGIRPGGSLPGSVRSPGSVLSDNNRRISPIALRTGFRSPGIAGAYRQAPASAPWTRAERSGAGLPPSQRARAAGATSTRPSIAPSRSSPHSASAAAAWPVSAEPAPAAWTGSWPCRRTAAPPRTAPSAHDRLRARSQRCGAEGR